MNQLDQKKYFIQKISDIILRQQEAIKAGDMEQLTYLINQRQRFMDAVDNLHDDIVDDELMELIYKMQAMDESNIQMLKQAMYRTKEHLDSISVARNGLLSYNASKNFVPVAAFIDKKM